MQLLRTTDTFQVPTFPKQLSYISVLPLQKYENLKRSKVARLEKFLASMEKILNQLARIIVA